MLHVGYPLLFTNELEDGFILDRMVEGADALHLETLAFSGESTAIRVVMTCKVAISATSL